MLLYPPHSKEEEGKENANEGADADFFVAADGELLLGPNDWEDGCHDNSGSLRVEVITNPVSRAR